jgi:hypothetical protein
VSHYVLDDGRLVVAHAGLSEELQGRGSGKVRDFALFGETTGETDEFGLPVRLALREFALGIEGLERFVQREPLRRVHECVFGVLALESEPVDPRL